MDAPACNKLHMLPMYWWPIPEDHSGLVYAMPRQVASVLVAEGDIRVLILHKYI